MAYLHLFGPQIAAFRPDLYRAALRRGLQPADAENAVQNTFLIALDDTPDARIPFDPTYNGPGFYGILSDILSFEVRKYRPARQREVSISESDWNSLPDDEEATAEEIREELRLLALGAKLTKKQAFCYYAWLVGYTQEETADELGVTHQAVSTHLLKARARIRMFVETGGVVISPRSFRTLSKQIVYRKPRTTGAGLAKMTPVQRRRNELPV